MTAQDISQINQSGTQILHPGSRKLFRYWEGLRAERACPQRSEIDLRAISDLVENLVIIESHENSGEWIYRLAGSEVCRLMNQNLTAQNALSKWDRFERNVIGKSFNIAKTRVQPCLIRSRFIYDVSPPVAAELIVLPVLADSTQSTQLFGGLFAFHGQAIELSEHMVRQELVSTRMIWTEHQNANALISQVNGARGNHLRVIQGGLV